ncbi:MAG: dephospho-CoA kinase [Rhodospirillaceae bacterium]|nr:dephospho-CoA kinase [Rhodospirillaceae bacterium]MDD9917361.1 dephospho-CoA kinase [Rhodospirillaceae bacterium]MDD9924370.1 dephospho-CoA kinase [Rhodospirillaceae bacterium]
MIIGLTGGIASGKSTAAAYLGEKGASVIDADKLGHRAYEPDTDAFAQVVAAFGPEVVGADGQIDRKVLGGKVFGDPAALDRLTGIIWPEIGRLALAEFEVARAAQPDAPIVLEAAVMLEAGWEPMVDEVWVVIVEPDTAVARATARDGVEEEAVRKRIAAQLSNDERRAKADIVIDNSRDEAALLAQLDAQWKRIA